MELASEREQLIETKRLKSRFSKFSKHSQSSTNKPTPEQIQLSDKKLEISVDSSYLNRSPSGYSNMKSGDSIEWDQGDWAPNNPKNKAECTVDSNIKKYDSVFDEESK